MTVTTPNGGTICQTKANTSHGQQV